jgi:hypothetical protein
MNLTVIFIFNVLVVPLTIGFMAYEFRKYFLKWYKAEEIILKQAKELDEQIVLINELRCK